MAESVASIPTAASRDDYVVDASGFKGWAETVFLPSDETAVIDILRQAGSERIPVTVIGARSGLTGGGIARGGWVISLEAFRHIQIARGHARVGAAVTLLEFRDAAAPTRQFYAPDPTEITASVGGTIATNASGSRSFLYGSTRRHVSAIRVALMDGSIREFRRGDKIDFDVPQIPWPDTRKCTAGYPLAPGMDYIDLFCGSEGTLGVVLEAELTLLPIPRGTVLRGHFLCAATMTPSMQWMHWRPIGGTPHARVCRSQFVGPDLQPLSRDTFARRGCAAHRGRRPCRS